MNARVARFGFLALVLLAVPAVLSQDSGTVGSSYCLMGYPGCDDQNGACQDGSGTDPMGNFVFGTCQNGNYTNNFIKFNMTSFTQGGCLGPALTSCSWSPNTACTTRFYLAYDCFDQSTIVCTSTQAGTKCVTN